MKLQNHDITVINITYFVEYFILYSHSFLRFKNLCLNVYPDITIMTMI